METPATVDSKTGEVLSSWDPTWKWQLRTVARLALPDHRIHVCMNHIRSDQCDVEVRGARAGDRRPYFANLMACGSVWACPICAAKIQAVRAAEVRAGIDAWTDRGGSVLMSTLTVPHRHTDALYDVTTGILDAYRRHTTGAPMKRLKASHGIAGGIRSLEVTHGSHGWHPHLHVLMFLEDAADVDELRAGLFKRWQSATSRAGFGPLSRKAFSLQDGSAVRTYVTKMGTEYQWNAEHELVKGHTKSGRRGNSTPFDMLARYTLEDENPLHLALFREFATNFHGKNQLVYSRGFRRVLLGNVADRSDEQIAASIGEHDDVLARIAAEDWKLIRRQNLHGSVLQVVHHHGRDGLNHMLSALREAGTTLAA